PVNRPTAPRTVRGRPRATSPAVGVPPAPPARCEVRSGSVKSVTDIASGPLGGPAARIPRATPAARLGSPARAKRHARRVTTTECRPPPPTATDPTQGDRGGGSGGRSPLGPGPGGCAPRTKS